MSNQDEKQLGESMEYRSKILGLVGLISMATGYFTEYASLVDAGAILVMGGLGGIMIGKFIAEGERR